MSARQIGLLAKESMAAWIDDYAPSMGAALAFYTLFSLAPVLVIAISVAGLAFGQETARGEIVAQLLGLIGREGSLLVQHMLESTSRPATSVVASVASIVMLVVGASSVFSELQTDLDRIWRAPATMQPTGVWALIRARLLTFGMVLAIGFVLLVSLVVSAAIAALAKWGNPYFAGREFSLHVLSFGLDLVTITVLFALIYKILPRVHIAWTDVWVGAAVTASLFTLGKLGIGLYLGWSAVTTGFGAAGSLVMLLIWVYFSAQIFLLGAEFTWVFAHRHGSRAAAAVVPPSPAPSPAPAIPSRSREAHVNAPPPGGAVIRYASRRPGA